VQGLYEHDDLPHRLVLPLRGENESDTTDEAAKPPGSIRMTNKNAKVSESAAPILARQKANPKGNGVPEKLHQLSTAKSANTISARRRGDAFDFRYMGGGNMVRNTLSEKRSDL